MSATITASTDAAARYAQVQQRLSRGWNTFNNYSILSHVLLPAGLSINLGVKEYRDGQFLAGALIGRQDKDEEVVRPGPRTCDGRYTHLDLTWRGITLTVETASTENDDFVVFITPAPLADHQRIAPTLILQAGMMWGRNGLVHQGKTELIADLGDRKIRIGSSSLPMIETNIPWTGPYLALKLDQPVALWASRQRSSEEIRALIGKQKAAQETNVSAWGDLGEIYSAIETVIAWDTIYDPAKQRAISPVSRLWSIGSGGSVLFEWDTYFAAYLASVADSGLAFANAVEMTREITPAGIVPNVAAIAGYKSLDRSEPPVGAIMVREIYRRFKEPWFIELIFDDLLRWNRWWAKERTISDGLLAWGSTPYEQVTGNFWERPENGVNARFGASLESGLDNSPMYDDIPFDADKHCLKLQDVGLNGLYVADCEALAELAMVIAREDAARELSARGKEYRDHMQLLWDEKTGMFLNRRTDTGEFSHRISPTNFYALLAGAATDKQANRMVEEHLCNPKEFWGEWVLPSIARNDPAHPEQNYWRGRIWAPMNFLVYLGLRRSNQRKAASDLAKKSADLLLAEWRTNRHVHENYNANTGQGCDVSSSDRFYHWGALLGMPTLIEAGKVAAPEEPLDRA